MKKWKNRCTAWIACLAILAAAFMPSISAALTHAHEASAAATKICSPEHAAHASAGQKHVPAQHKGHADHCPLCAKQTNAYDLLQGMPDFAVPEFAPGPHLMPVGQDRFYSAVAWIHLPPRAPPARS